MNRNRWIGVVVIILGFVLLGVASHINSEVAKGKGEISRGQNQVDTTNKLFGLNPYTKDVGKGLTSSGQEQINAGNVLITKYEGIAGWCQIGGYVLIVLGAGVFIFGGNRGKSRK